MQQDREILREFGLKVSNANLEETLKIINASHKEQIEKIRAYKKENTEQNFLKNIITSYKQEINAKNNKVVFKDNTFLIRTVDPQDIESITQRAYFNSFNIQRNKSSELIDSPQKGGEINPSLSKDFASFPKTNKQGQILDDKQQCFCGKNIVGQNWVECDNRQNCKGSTWFHYSCVGLKQNDNVENQTFICSFCKNSDGNSEPDKRKIAKS